MTDDDPLPRLRTGIKNLDAILGGGLPKASVTVIAGPPGSGKTILTEQFCFHNAKVDEPVLYFGTLSEPIAKTLRYLKKLAFFDKRKIGHGIELVDLGEILRMQGLDEARRLMLAHVKRVRPAIVVVDSFKVFDDLARSRSEVRKFAYETAVDLMAWQTTALLLGEYAPAEEEVNPLFSVVDGLITMTQRESAGENQRFLRVVKLRGTGHSRDEHPFVISDAGVEVFAPRQSTRREEAGPGPVARCRTGISKLDELLGPGIPWGSSLLLSGVAGTGKTVLSLEFLYRGALAGEKGIFFSFEETEERLRATALGLGWDLTPLLEQGLIEIVFIPQPEIVVEAHLSMMRERIAAMGAKRVVIDSVSVFLHKVTDPQQTRERVFHLCSIVQNAGAVALFPTDIPYGSGQISRFGVEETVVDGVVILSASEEGFGRQRYIEIYKLRNTAHMKGRHNMLIKSGGVAVFPRYEDEGGAVSDSVPPVDIAHRIGSGVAGLDALLGGGLLRRSVTLIRGAAGAGKSTLAVQFLLEGAERREPGLYVSLEEGRDQVLASAASLDLHLNAAVADGLVEIHQPSAEALRVGELLSVLSDRIVALHIQRVVVDAATHLTSAHAPHDDGRSLLSTLVNRFKSLGATTIVTVESLGLTERDCGNEPALSPIADNLVLLRYRDEIDRLVPTLTVVKTRGSSHDRGTYELSIGRGGARIATFSLPKGKGRQGR